MLDPDRAEFLRNRIKASQGRTEYVSAWPRHNKDLPAVELDVEWVRFSTLNHRTRAEQEKAIRQSGHKGLFAADPLGYEAQEAQYKILSQQEGFADIKADLRERGQQHPAIITADGILINGNRRVAAMRSLFKENYLKAQYVRCLILPEDATAEEVVDLEAELQIAREFKQDYSWVNEALLIQELYDREGKSFERVAARMHRNPKDVQGMYEKIQQVHQLVALSQGTRHLVDFSESESVFDELAKHIRNKPDKEKNDVRTVYFLGTLAGTEYRTLRNLRRPDAVALVLDEIESDPALRPIMNAAKVDSPSGSEDELLDEILGVPAQEQGLDNLLGYVATKRLGANVTLPDGEKIPVAEVMSTLKNAITAAAHEAEELNKDQVALSAPLDRVEKAISELHRAAAQLPNSRALSEWNESAFREKVARLDKIVAKLKVVR